MYEPGEAAAEHVFVPHTPFLQGPDLEIFDDTVGRF